MVVFQPGPLQNRHKWLMLVHVRFAIFASGHITTLENNVKWFAIFTNVCLCIIHIKTI
jgi:hypothetical protein